MTPRLLMIGTMISLWILAPTGALAALISTPGDAALAGALVQNFDGEPTDTYFASRTFLIGSDGFTVTPLAAELHIDGLYCGNFGTTGNCLDTMNNAGQGNDDFDVVFTGAGVTAFGFAVNGLDTAWTIETYDVNDIMLGSYTIPSQSPGLTGNNRRGYFGATEAQLIQYFTVRSAGNDRALIDDFAFVPIPEPNVSMLISLGMLMLAGTRAGEQRKRRPTSSALSN